MPLHRADVLVVGTGPAGSVAALAVRRGQPGATVWAVDRAEFPRDKVCGDGLGPGVIRTLRALQLEYVLDGAPRPDDVRVTGPAGHEGRVGGAVIGGREMSGAVLPRRDFDDRLRRVSVAEGVEFHAPWKLVAVQPHDGAVCARFTTPAGEESVDARVLVGADGAYSAVRRLWPAFTSLPKKHTLVAMRGYAQVVDPVVAHGDPASLRLDFTRELLPAYGWVFPAGGGISNVGVGLPVPVLAQPGRTLRQHFDDYVRSLGERGFAVDSVRDVKSHQLPHSAGMSRFTDGAVCLVGDAAAMINPLSGEGIFYGMAAGEALGRALSGVDLGDPARVRRALAGYERGFRDRFRLHFASCWVCHRLLRSARCATMATKAASRDQQVMADAALLLFDERTMSPWTALRILASGM